MTAIGGGDGSCSCGADGGIGRSGDGDIGPSGDSNNSSNLFIEVPGQQVKVFMFLQMMMVMIMRKYVKLRFTEMCCEVLLQILSLSIVYICTLDFTTTQLSTK
jgi:hypothetical protein